MDNSVKDHVDTILEEEHFDDDDATILDVDQRLDDFETIASKGTLQKRTFQSANDLTDKRNQEKYSVMDNIVTVKTHDCCRTSESLLENESVKEFTGKINETDDKEVSENQMPFQSFCTVTAVNTINGESGSNNDTDMPNFENINEELASNKDTDMPNFVNINEKLASNKDTDMSDFENINGESGSNKDTDILNFENLNGESESDKDTDMFKFENIIEASEPYKDTAMPTFENTNGLAEVMTLSLQFPHNCSYIEGEAIEKHHDQQCNISDINENGCRGKLTATMDDFSDSCFLSSDDKESNVITRCTDETSVLFPSFEQIYDNDSETSSNSYETHECFPLDMPVISTFDENCDSDLENSSSLQACFDNFGSDRPVIFSPIPNFEMLENNADDASGNKSSGFADKNVIELLKEIKNDLVGQNDNHDIGLAELFEESQPGVKHSSNVVKSKAAKKRKKQQQKLRKLVVNTGQTENNRRKFAQSFQELQKSQVIIDDSDIDSSITCPVCLEMYHMPSTCNPCGHIFCDPCLRRLTGQGSEGIPCPLCRTVIYSCELNKDFDEFLSLAHPDIYRARAMFERHTKFRHYQLPYTAPVPLGKRLMRQLVASRNSQSDTRWMSHDWFKFLLGCTAGMCLSLLIMLFNRVKSVRDARDVNIMFLSILIGASVTFLIFKYIKI